MMKLCVYDRLDRKLIAENKLFSPLAYRDAKRCDLHPRPILKGDKLTAVYVDSTHSGHRRLWCFVPEENNNG
jgi:hypothetical protein